MGIEKPKVLTVKVHQIYTFSPLRNFSYFLEDINEIYCIDPFDGAACADFIKGLNKPLRAIINTHEHPDHIMGNDELQRQTGCEIWAHEKARGKIKNIDRYLKDDEILDVESGEGMKVLFTPGHTCGHLCLLFEGSLICGDTLFNAGVGHCKLGGDPHTLYETFENVIFNLDEDVVVYPGHDYLVNNLKFTLSREPNNQKAKELLEKVKDNKEGEFMTTTLGLEKEINTFFRLDNDEIKNHLEGDTSSRREVFLRLRELRNNW